MTKSSSPRKSRAIRTQCASPSGASCGMYVISTPKREPSPTGLADLRRGGVDADDDADLLDPGAGHVLDAVEDDRLVGDRHELLGARVRDRPQARAGTTCEDESLHRSCVYHDLAPAEVQGRDRVVAGRRDAYERADDCDLCEAARITPWFHEDDICWIAECEICAVPDGRVARSRREPAAERAVAHARPARRAWSSSTSSSSTTSTTTCGTSPTTTTRTRGRSAASSVTDSGAGLSRAAPEPSTSDALTDHVLTIDLGTSGPKVALFTVDGAYVDGDSAPVDVQLTADGGARATARRRGGRRSAVAAQDVCADAVPRRRTSVVAVSVTSQWSGTVPIDAQRRSSLHDAIIWMDSRGAGVDPQARRRPRPRAGLRPAQAAPVDQAHRRRAVTLGQGSRSRTSCGSKSTSPTIARATWKYLEPKDWLNFKLTGVAAATFDSIVLHWVTDNRDLDAHRLRRRAARAGRHRPRPAARPRPGHRRDR